MVWTCLIKHIAIYLTLKICNVFHNMSNSKWLTAYHRVAQIQFVQSFIVSLLAEGCLLHYSVFMGSWCNHTAIFLHMPWLLCINCFKCFVIFCLLADSCVFVFKHRLFQVQVNTLQALRNTHLFLCWRMQIIYYHLTSFLNPFNFQYTCWFSMQCFVILVMTKYLMQIMGTHTPELRPSWWKLKSSPGCFI